MGCIEEVKTNNTIHFCLIGYYVMDGENCSRFITVIFFYSLILNKRLPSFSSISRIYPPNDIFHRFYIVSSFDTTHLAHSQENDQNAPPQSSSYITPNNTTIIIHSFVIQASIQSSNTIFNLFLNHHSGLFLPRHHPEPFTPNPTQLLSCTIPRAVLINPSVSPLTSSPLFDRFRLFHYNTWISTPQYHLTRIHNASCRKTKEPR